jgi:1-acyl-sn-glycerol-3-phosphate acyltransferase
MYELMLLSDQEYVDMYATSMKDRIVAAARTKARELQEAALPGTAAKELEEALDAQDDESSRRVRPSFDDAVGDIDELTARDDVRAGAGVDPLPAEDAGDEASDEASDEVPPGARAAS